jgi:hypothetical protein
MLFLEILQRQRKGATIFFCVEVVVPHFTVVVVASFQGLLLPATL